MSCRISLAAVLMMAAASACSVEEPNPPLFNNVTDPTNGGAEYVGSSACLSCHRSLLDVHPEHAHAQALKPIKGLAPDFPDANPVADVPDPPEGFTWDDISYVLGGYLAKANYVDLDGFFLTTAATDVDTQWNLLSVPASRPAGFLPFRVDDTEPLPFDYSCFKCHTTGAEPFDPDDPKFHENRPGMAGTFVQAGVQCEACHGPGSNHIPDPSARDLYVDPTGDVTCNACHANELPGPRGVQSANGYIVNAQQYNEILVSGGHAGFSCGNCHNPHASIVAESEFAIRNACTDCHDQQNMALHAGKVFSRDDGYTEVLRCESCHMPYATAAAAAADASVVGSEGRMADVRTHIFRTNTDAVTFTEMFTDGGARVRTDELGRAAVTLDFVCLRCHNGNGAFEISLGGASNVATRIHVAPGRVQ